MKIGILTPGHAPEDVARSFGDYDAMFRDLLAGQGFAFETWDVERMAFPDSPADADAWIVGGSRHGAYEDHPFIPPLERFLRAAWDARRRVVGVCFGHQVLAQALGGRVEKAASGWSLGATDYALAGGGRVRLNAWHQDQVTALPPVPVEVLATSDACPFAALRYGDRALTVQAHPEFRAGVIADFVRLRRGAAAYPDAMLDAAAASALRGDAGLDRDRLARAIAAFLRGGAPDGLGPVEAAGAAHVG